MEFFPNFAWAVPSAFSDALAACRFEEGDILYDSKKAYELKWGTAQKHIKHSFIVREPKRSSVPSGAKKTDSDGRVEGVKSASAAPVFEKNWDSPALIEISVSRSADKRKVLETTQGRIYTTLWKGDPKILSEGHQPACPLQLRDVTRRMERLEQFVRQTSLFPVFVIATDSTNEISREKLAKVRAAVRRRFSATEQIHPAMVLGMGDGDSVAPTVSLVAFEFPRGKKDEIEDALKSVLYKPSKSAKNPKFRLPAHGALFA